MQQPDLSLAIVTPSYHRDFERCALLADSIKRFVPADLIHYIIVDRRDFELFQALAGPRTRILRQEDLVQQRTFRLPFLPKWRFSWKTLPIRGWIWQQLVKISIASAIAADVYMMVDSDCFFTRDFDPRSLIKGGKTPFFREVKDFYKTNVDSQRWDEVGRRLLRLPPQTGPAATGYVAMHVFWRRDLLQKMCAYVAAGGSPRSWISRIARNLTFSEYVLYGMYVEQVCGLATSGHYLFERDLCHSYWPETRLDAAGLAAFRDETPPDRVMGMVNAKSQTPVALIRQTFFGNSLPGQGQT